MPILTAAPTVVGSMKYDACCLFGLLALAFSITLPYGYWGRDLVFLDTLYYVKVPHIAD